MTLLLMLALQSGFEEKLDALLPKLRSDDPETRNAAREELRKAARADEKKQEEQRDKDLEALIEAVRAHTIDFDEFEKKLPDDLSPDEWQKAFNRALGN